MTQLQAALDSAPKESDMQPSKNPMSADEYQDMIIKIATKHCNNAFDELQDPVLHKAMAVCILHNLLCYHQRKAESLAAEGEIESAFMWVKDYGKLQVLIETLKETSISHTDFFAQDISSDEEGLIDDDSVATE